MAANAMQFPAALRFRELMFHPDVPSRSGGLSTTGYEQVTVSGSGRWRANGTVLARGEEEVLSYRAMLAALEGRAGTMLVPAPFSYRPRNHMGQMLSACRTASYSDGLGNFDWSWFGQADTIHATVHTAAAQRDTEILITVLDGEGLRPGHYFGIADRLYVASHVYRETEADPTTVRFWPPLRAAAPVGTRVILDRPACLMRLAEDASGEMMLTNGRWGEANLSLVEVV